MRLLFVKNTLAWPRATGHDVYTYHTMKACVTLGHEVSLAVAAEPAAPAIEGVALRALYRLDAPQASGGHTGRPTWLQRKFQSFFGTADSRLAALSAAVAASRAEVVIVIGLDVLPYFTVLDGVTRVWFAADELMWHHLSQLSFESGNLIFNLREGLLKGVYERAFCGLIDRAWVVSEPDRRAMRWLAGVRKVDVLALGVDGDQFAPGNEPVEAHTAVFWGRLDFGPNIQALEWFCGKIWPQVRARVPDARFTVIGYHPTDAVRRMAGAPGITLLPDVPDLRSTVRSHSLVVLPFISGGGIKNKLLEAAALGMPIVCTPLATNGLRFGATTPLAVESTSDGIRDRIIDLWTNDERRRALGSDARRWVVEHHTWLATAQDAMATLGANNPAGRTRP
jgi:glycosyltransferase involved in cell wall biosynthesis